MYNFKLFIYFALAFLVYSCNNTANKTSDEIDVSIKEENEENELTKKIEAIYFNVPSPMETVVLLKKAGVAYNYDLPLNPNKVNEYFDREERAVLLGVYGADLNYSVVSNKNQETLLYFKSVHMLGEEIGLANVFNDELKNRVYDNLENNDSMQVIISDAFWNAESSLKEDARLNISALIVAGGWIEGLYISSQLSKLTPDNEKIKMLIAEQKYSIANLIYLLDSYNISDYTKEILIKPIKNLEPLFNNIEEKYSSESVNSENEDIPVIGANISLSYSNEILDSITVAIAQIREEIIH